MDQLINRLQAIKAEKGRLLLAIDGRCGCGKSSLAAALAEVLEANVFHVDDFYLPFAAREPDWPERIAGNIDLARLRRELLEPLRAGQDLIYRPYDAHADRWKPECRVPFRAFSILEGSYCLHPSLADCYDFSLFVTAGAAVQERRLRAREGDRFSAFAERWIPMEERYFARCDLPARADLILTGEHDGRWEPV